MRVVKRWFRTARSKQLHLYRSIQITGLRDSSVGTVTKLRIGHSLVGSRKKFYLFSKVSRPALGPMFTAASLLGRKGGRKVMLITPHCLVPAIKTGGAITLWRAQVQIYL
jgi:hypothetical protein